MIELSQELLIIFILGYMIGSISPSLLIGKLFFHTDIRVQGSKNLGGSNAGRVLGAKVGIIVIVLDFLKGYIAVWIASMLTTNHDYIVIAGLTVILGHIFPLFAKFQGGKGVATTGGVILYLKPILIPVSLVIILIFWLITKYESLAALMAFTYLLVLTMMNQGLVIAIFAVMVYIGILYAHRRNIKAILQKTEAKKNIFSKFK